MGERKPPAQARGFSVAPKSLSIFRSGKGEEPSKLDKMLRRQVAPDMRIKGVEGSILKKSAVNDADISNQEILQEGLVPRPFDFTHVIDYFTISPHHSTCISAKRVSTVGLGLVGEKAEPRDVDPEQLLLGQDKGSDDEEPSETETKLNALCSVSFLDLMLDVCEDYWEYGTGYMEVVRGGEGDEITGLHHLAAKDTWVYLEDDDGRNFHFVVMLNPDAMGAAVYDSRRFARFGDKTDFLSRWSAEAIDAKKVSEVICFRQSSNKSRWYGFPDWLSAVPRIELSRAISQFQHDFFYNRGVPEFILFVLGQTLSDDDWEAVESSLKASVGRGNSHKSVGFNFGHPDVRIQLERLAMDTAADPTQFAKTAETVALEIVSAHRVPPMVAGIMIPGKLGAANELTNSILGFQTLVIGPTQKTFTTTLKATLGEDGFDAKGFKFHTITEAMREVQNQPGMKEAETMSRMRTPVAGGDAPQPGGKSGTGRNLSDGLKKNG